MVARPLLHERLEHEGDERDRDADRRRDDLPERGKEVAGRRRVGEDPVFEGHPWNQG